MYGQDLPGKTSVIQCRRNKERESCLAVPGVMLKGSRQSISVLQYCNGYRIYNGKMGAPKKKVEVSTRFSLSLASDTFLTTCPSSPGDRESISAVILIDLLRKKKE